MNTSEFVDLISSRTKIPKSTIEKVMICSKNCITECARKGENVMLKGFATFKLVERPERLCTNPQTGRKFFSPSKKKIVVKLSKSFSKV